MLKRMALRQSLLRKLGADTRAVTAIEYGLICSLIFLVIVSGITQVQSQVVALWVLIASKI
jgi:pilus assembly protein Flp/PilA